jgi:hypothetical protein
MKLKLGIFTLLIVTVIAGCSSLKVNADMDKTADFASFKTYEYYGWADNSDQILNQMDKERIEKAFGMELSDRGMTLVSSGGDLIVTLHIVTQQKQQTTATTTGMGGGMGYGYGGYYGYGPGYGWGGGMSTTSYNTYDYTAGTLVIDIYDAAEKKLIFESTGSGEINEKTKGRDDRIKDIASRMMYTYPVKKLKEDN